MPILITLSAASPTELIANTMSKPITTPRYLRILLVTSKYYSGVRAVNKAAGDHLLHTLEQPSGDQE